RAGGRRPRRRRRGRGLPVPDRLRHGGSVSTAAQAWAVARLELRRALAWRNAWLLCAAFAPLAIIAAHVTLDRSGRHKLEDESLVLSAILQLYYLRAGIFFAALGVFMRLL